MNATLFEEAGLEPSAHRVEALARVLAGFAWPGRSFENLTKPQREAALAAAREALNRVGQVP